MRYILLIFIVMLSGHIYCQITTPNIDFYGGGAASIGETKPFWNISNQFGKYSLDPYEGIVGTKIEAIDSSGTFLSIDYGVELYNRLQRNEGFVIHQGYLAVKSPLLMFWAGRKEEIIGSQDTLLSIGSTVWSRNARPMPKLALATPGYVDVPFTKGYVEVNGSLAHGWFEQDRYVKNVYLHQKHLHLRFGGDFFINASLGLIHFAQWGGNSPDPRFGDLPSDWDAYKRVFLAQSGDSSTVNINEVINKLGNHLGARVYRVEINTNNLDLGFYYQTIFEDGSGFAHEFYRDGLSGFSLKTKDSERYVNHFIFEFLHTTWQSGPIPTLPGVIKKKENDNYFGNYIYRSGWTYHKMILGTPLITSPILNEDGSERILNSRVQAFHLGIGGMLMKLNYYSFFTYSINKGTYMIPIDPQKNQFSWYFETTIPSIWLGIDLNIMLAADFGNMYGNNLGVNFIFSKRIFRKSEWKKQAN